MAAQNKSEEMRVCVRSKEAKLRLHVCKDMSTSCNQQTADLTNLHTEMTTQNFLKQHAFESTALNIGRVQTCPDITIFVTQFSQGQVLRYIQVQQRY